ncbi:hypothetical protein [Paraburkholderia oxyphila]|uniref:hypothetical protein n=1 Tax=Paraburkholderia oxyphila TaxID=614212 RepID=UPI0004825BE2|nr:hypothetical protein [Paraburkholderia oxyphila]
MATVKKLHRLRHIFLVIFALSLVVWAVAYQREVARSVTKNATPSALSPALQANIDRLTKEWMDQPIRKDPGSVPQELNSPVLWISTISSVASLIGALTTTFIAVRKERRESTRASLENEKLELENTRLRRELEAKGAADEPPA